MTRPDPRRITGLEALTVLHVGLFLAATTWAFGGNADWVRAPLSVLGSAGALITLAMVLGRNRFALANRRMLRWLWPWLAFNALVLLGLLHPLFRVMSLEGESLLVAEVVPTWLPANAMPEAALSQLWLFDAIYLSCFNLLLVVEHRRPLRWLLLVALGNALTLAVFGTLQKLSHATGLYFGAVKSPQTTFFASFIYHNHWGAFMILMSALTLGLLWHFGRRSRARNFLHTPAFALLVVLLIFAITVPLSTSRSCSVLLLILLGASFCHWLARLRCQRHTGEKASVRPMWGAVAAIILAGAGIWYLDRDVIVQRVAKTSEQLSDLRAEDGLNSRAALYRDTWRMAAARPWFGWGPGSYPHVFTLYNSQEPDPRDHLPKFYHDAHSDWLQALAEHGFFGTALLVLCAFVPLRRVWRQAATSCIPLYLFFGCSLVLLYAAVEFPFGNVAVVLSWWMCFFCAIRYVQLQPVASRLSPINPA
jgi:O-antigen ligase